MIAVYPGSFDPVTAGHYDIIKRASAMFDKLIVLVAGNTAKSPMFSAEERVELLQKACAELDNVVVDQLRSGLMIEYAKEQGARVILKGLRAVSDFEYELQMALINRRLEPEIETIFLMAGSEHSFLSSAIVKGIGKLGGQIDGLVPDAVLPALQERFHQ